jgi:hypothetical protein
VKVPTRSSYRAVFAVCCIVASVTAAPTSASSQTPAQRPRFEIVDNSFLVEEAFNQESGVVQTIASFARSSLGDWALMFTQEWPFRDVTHQLSYSIPLSRIESRHGMGDVLINYRFQAISEDSRRPAFTPRLSLLVPTGNSEHGFGYGRAGWQVNLPLSKQAGRWYFHGNAGFTYVPQVQVSPDDDARRVALFSPAVGGSAIVQISPLVNLLFESVSTSDERVDDSGVHRGTTTIFSPGLRRGWNLADKQIVVGGAAPITLGKSPDAGFLLYFSYEARFRK